MDDEAETKKPPRLAGGALKLSARLLETPGVGNPLYRLATKQLGIDVLRERDIPVEVPPFRFTHLGDLRQRDEEGGDA